MRAEQSPTKHEDYLDVFSRIKDYKLDRKEDKE